MLRSGRGGTLSTESHVSVDWAGVVSDLRHLEDRCGESEVTQVLVRALGPASIEQACDHVLAQMDGWTIVEQVLRWLKPRQVFARCLEVIQEKSFASAEDRPSSSEAPSWRDGDRLLSAVRLLRYVALSSDVETLAELTEHTEPMARSLAASGVLDTAYEASDQDLEGYGRALAVMEANQDPHVRGFVARVRRVLNGDASDEMPEME